MIKFGVKFILVGTPETEVNHIVMGEDASDAVWTALRKHEDSNWPRPIEVGDCAIVTGRHTPYKGYFIIDAGFQLKSVGLIEFNLWREHLGQSQFKTMGVDYTLSHMTRR